MKVIVASFLSVLIFASAGCMKNDSPNVGYYEGAALVKESDSKKPTFEGSCIKSVEFI